MQKQRCHWVNLKNPLYIKYHDEEWSVAKHNDKELFELLILETFQAGLSWECILNKRENFRKAYDDFDIDKIIKYNDKKIQIEFGSFDKYIWGFTNNKVIKESYKLRSSSQLSDNISKDLKKRGMSFVGTTIIYSYLQAIGIINAHSKDCFLG